MTKPVPYYPFYAANLIANRQFRLMTLEERGLWITIQMECWVNGSVPSDSSELAKYLGVTYEEVQRSFTQKQLSFLKRNGTEFQSPELEEQREEFMLRREKQRLGGHEGAKRKKAKQESEGARKGIGTPKGQPTGSLTYVNSNSINSNQLINKGVVKSTDPWLAAAFDDEPSHVSNDYAKQSKG